MYEEVDIEGFLAESPDHFLMIIMEFYEDVMYTKSNVLPICYRFSQIEKDLEDFNNIFLACTGTHRTGPYFKVKSRDFNFLVNYSELHHLVMTRQQKMYILERDAHIDLTTSLAAKQAEDDSYVGTNHCQAGSKERHYVIANSPFNFDKLGLLTDFRAGRALRYTLSFRSYRGANLIATSNPFIIYTDTLSQNWTRILGPDQRCSIGNIQRTLRRNLETFFRTSRKYHFFIMIDPENEIEEERFFRDRMLADIDTIFVTLCNGMNEGQYSIGQPTPDVNLFMYITDLHVGL